jgi:hypothetical protein
MDGEGVEKEGIKNKEMCKKRKKERNNNKESTLIGGRESIRWKKR